MTGEERAMPGVNQRLARFGTSIFAEMSGLAVEHGAINLSQGFPDFDGPAFLVDAANDAMRAGKNQYARSMGVTELVTAIAAHRAHFYGIDLDPMREIVVTAGATEGIAATLLGLVEPGDEVIVFEPFYDSYPACVAMAGGVVKTVRLAFPDLALDVDVLRAACTDKTKLILLNTPHNPTGKVFTREELTAIASIAVEKNVLVVADEVYEHLTFDGAVHIPIATLPGMRERTITLSSAGKTFSYTGWKIGWAMGPASLIAGVQNAHQFLTFAVSTPFQFAVAHALYTVVGGAYLDAFKSEYAARRTKVLRALDDAGLRAFTPAGTYFITADFSALSDDDDRTFAKWMTRELRVACIPPSVFYASDAPRSLLRFAFCKRDETLDLAAERLRGLRDRVRRA
jgi:N-succinyldiaminopimelate aminotransferase